MNIKRVIAAAALTVVPLTASSAALAAPVALRVHRQQPPRFPPR